MTGSCMRRVVLGGLTCEQEQHGVAPAAGALHPLHPQVCVAVLSGHHRHTPPHRPHAVVCQEVLFDEAQRVVRGVVQATLTQAGREKYRYTLGKIYL